MKRLLLVGLLGIVAIQTVGCLTLEQATREGCVLMTQRVNARIPAENRLTSAQERAFGDAFFDQSEEDYKMLEDWLKGLGKDGE